MEMRMVEQAKAPWSSTQLPDADPVMLAAALKEWTELQQTVRKMDDIIMQCVIMSNEVHTRMTTIEENEALRDVFRHYGADV